MPEFPGIGSRWSDQVNRSFKRIPALFVVFKCNLWDKKGRWRRAGEIFFRKRTLLPALVLFAGILFWNCLPKPLFETPYSTVILDHEGGLLGASIAPDGQWCFPPDGNVPEKFVQAITSYEDRRFFWHPGVDPLAVARALWLNCRSGGILSGASTISMQVIRLSRHGRPRTLREKLIEALLAIRLEISLSKEDILAQFSSHAPFGGNVVGIEAAAWRYFGCSPDRLSWAETAMLAVLPNSPSLIHPGKNRERLRQKRDFLLDRLYEDGRIDSLTCKLSKLEPLPPKPHPIPMLAPHLLSRIRMSGDRQGSNINTKKKGTCECGRIRTTIQNDLQIRVTQIIHRYHRDLAGNGIHNAAAVVLDVEGGKVLAYVGNISDLTDTEHGNHVDIILAPRSTGSILKPLLYAGMIHAGELLPTQLVPDIPTQMGGFAPENYSRTYQGAVPAYMALARSLNVPAVRMLKSYGVDRFYTLLKGLGMTTLHRPAQDYGLSLILGGAEGTLWDITTIYAGMAHCVNHAYRFNHKEAPPLFQPRLVYHEASGHGNKQTYQADVGNTIEPILDPVACWLTLEAMLEVGRPGVESVWCNFTSSRKIAWKTGTSYGLRDGWAVGVTPRYAVGVWAGNADGEGRPGLTGIATAAPILFEIFGLLDDQGWFDPPYEDLFEIDVCTKSGYRAGPYCEKTKGLLVPQSGLRTKGCPYCRIIHCDSSLKWQVHSECERVCEITSAKWFVLPPVMEWYYKRKHSDYHPLPSYRDNCFDSMEGFKMSSISMIYPGRKARIYIPYELDGQRGRTVFSAAHRNARSMIYWHLDEHYLGATRDIHQMALSPGPGEHTLTLIDENGEYLENKFVVLTK